MVSCQCSLAGCGCGCNTLYLRTITGIIKIVEMVLVLVALFIFRTYQKAYFGGLDAQIFGGGVLVASLIITPLLFFSYLFGRLDIAATSILEPAINLILCAFLGISGALALRIGWDASLALGAFCVAAAITYAIDILQRYIKC